MWGEQGVLSGTHSISCAQKVFYRGNSEFFCENMSFSVNLYVKYNEIFLPVAFNRGLLHAHFSTNNAADASQAFKVPIICHGINISVLTSNGAFLKHQYFINILHRYKTGLGIPVKVQRTDFRNTVSSKYC